MLNYHRALSADAQTSALATLAVQADNAKLWVYLDEQQQARLVYVTNYVTEVNGQPSRPFSIIDANTGAVLEVGMA